jgi:acetate kinase
MTNQRHTETKVLVVNCGSSSIKYQLLAMDDGRMLAGGLLERIGETVSILRHRAAQGTAPLAESRREVIARDHREAFRHIGAALRAGDVFTGAGELAGIGHRVVHGGESFSEPTLIDSRVTESIRALSSLAPLHNPANLSGIEVCREAFPDVPQVAVFDTAFHQTMPPHAYRYAVPEEWYRDRGVRRYGFHGTSHRYVAERAADRLGRPSEQLNLITLHLGNGASAAAIEKGRCVDTSMGFTPLEGLVMGTRCGDLDPAVPLFIQKSAGLSAADVDRTLNQEAGLKGLCGTNDLREVLARELAGESRARLALELYGYRIKKYIGAYCAVLGTVDAVVFTGGVGENASQVRSLSCAGLERLGIALDEAANLLASRETREIGRAGLPVRVFVIPTNEELQIARETLAVVRLS